MSEHILVGPFFTRGEVARRLGVPPEVVRHRPDLLRVESRWLPEVYFAFQFDGGKVRRDVGSVVMSLHSEGEDLDIADWLVRPNADLLGVSPLGALHAGIAPERVVRAMDSAARRPPHAHERRAAAPASTEGASPDTGRGRAKYRGAGLSRPASSH